MKLTFVVAGLLLVFSFQNCADSKFQKQRGPSPTVSPAEEVPSTQAQTVSGESPKTQSVNCQYIDQYTHFLLGIVRSQDGKFTGSLTINAQNSYAEPNSQLIGYAFEGKSAYSQIVPMIYSVSSGGIESFESKDDSGKNFKVQGYSIVSSIMQMATVNIDISLTPFPNSPAVDAVKVSGVRMHCQHMHGPFQENP